MNFSRPTIVFTLACLLPFATAAVAADLALRQVPSPDLSRMPPARADDLRKLRASFEKISASVSGDSLAETYVLLGSAYARAGFYDAAAVALDDAVQVAPTEGRWVYAQGLVARKQQRTADAEKYFERAFALNKQYLPIRVAVISGLVDKGDMEAARRLLYDYNASTGGLAVSYSMLADISMRRKQYSQAVEELEHAIALDPTATSLNGQLADAYQASGDAKAAAAARAKLGNGVPQLVDPVGMRLIDITAPAAPAAATTVAGAKGLPATAASARANDVAQAQFLFATADYAGAAKKLDDALKLTPDDSLLLSLYARVDAEAGDLPRAREHAAAAITSNPKNALAQFAQGYVLEAGNDNEGAQRYYEKAIALDGTLLEPHLQMGNLLMRAGRFDQAAAQYRFLIDAKAGDAVAGQGWTRVVAAQTAAGKCVQALKDVNDGLAKDSRNGALLLLFVRLASTCPAADVQEKKMALDYGNKLYQQNDASAPIGEALALAQAANGKWDNATATQEGAIFALVRDRQAGETASYREFLAQFRAHKLPDRPWPAGSALYNPPRAGAKKMVAASAPAH